MITTFYRPDSNEETNGLLSETVFCITNARVADVIAKAMPGAPPYCPEEDSEVEHALRVWGGLLPSPSGHTYSMRATYGWTLIEVNLICNMLSDVYKAFHRLVVEVPALKNRLENDADSVQRLRYRWEDLLDET